MMIQFESLKSNEFMSFLNANKKNMIPWCLS
jgi:hypothetical protein